MGSGHMGTPTPVKRRTDMTENIAFPQTTNADGNKNNAFQVTWVSRVTPEILNESKGDAFT